MSTRWFSLRRRLLLLLLGGVSAFWLATLTLSYLDAHHEIDELFDAQIAQTAQTLLTLARDHEGHWHEDETAELAAATHKYQRKLRFQIWGRDGRLLLRSPNAPTTPLTDRDGFSSGALDAVEHHDARLDARPGDRGHGHDGAHFQQWRSFSQWDADRRYRVQVSEAHDIRNELSGKIAGKLLLPVLLGMPLLAAWLWLATRKGLAPLDEVASEIAARQPGHLEPLTPASAPNEIRPLVEALNGLFARVSQVMENERRFTADAAHELRTPLAALAAQAQVAQRASDAAQRDHAIEQVRFGVERAAHLVDQLLTLARLDPEQPLAERQALDLKQLVEESCAAHGVQALEKAIALELDAGDAATTNFSLVGSAALLRILLRNLLDNAIRYTPAGGQVQVTLRAQAGDIVLKVCDSGPGIPSEYRERVFRRFQRLAGQEETGSGLGLSIVQRIAELHGARVMLDDCAETGGLAVSVSFRA